MLLIRYRTIEKGLHIQTMCLVVIQKKMPFFRAGLLHPSLCSSTNFLVITVLKCMQVRRNTRWRMNLKLT